MNEVSIPHRDGIHIWNAIAVEGATALMVAERHGTNWKGHYTTSLLTLRPEPAVRANDLSERRSLSCSASTCGTITRTATARGPKPAACAAYDEPLKDVDLLLMPTLPLKATLLPARDASREDYVARALEMISNTCPFDVTGHPAASVPAGMSAGLPVGMMLIGRHWEDGTVLRAADAFQIVG